MKEDNFGYGDFLSPFTWRYGSQDMRRLFSEKGRRAGWRKAWVALAEAEAKRGLVSPAELADIKLFSGAEHVDIERAHELERTIRHDLMAELRVFASQSRKGGGKLHLGATSMDVEDNADMAVFRSGADILLGRLAACLEALAARIEEHKRTVCMGWTHLQPAEPTTLGYRFAGYAQDLLMDVKMLEVLKDTFMKGKGVKGAVGTSASFKALLGTDESVDSLEGEVMRAMGLKAFEVASQTYPRKVDFLLLSSLASIAQSCHKFGLDLRVMQSPGFGELSEPIGEKQVGSSAMPFKRNPVSSERMCSLARFVSVLPQVAFFSAASSVLERTLDDSAARRIVIPEAFLAVDECLTVYESLARGLVVYPAMIRRNLERYGPFAGTEAVLMRLAELGGDRQELHEKLRTKSFEAWGEVMKGRTNPLAELLVRDRSITSKIRATEVRKLLDPSRHVGNARSKCEAFVRKEVRPVLARYKPSKGGKGPKY